MELRKSPLQPVYTGERMSTSIFCVYNLAKRVFLSSKVTVADTVSQPLKVLKDLVALDAESGLWLTPMHGRPTIPKLFPYDLAYLNDDFQVVEIVEVVPGIEFPPHRPEVTSAVVLPPETLRSTQTGLGDPLIVCAKEDIQERLAGAGHAIQDSIAKNGAASASPEKRVSTETNGDTRAASGAPGVETIVAGDPVCTGRIPPPPPPAPPTETPVAGPEIPAVSITEVLIEKPHAGERQVQGVVEHRAGLEDLFANWVDSPSAPPSWITQKARERESAAPSALDESFSYKASAGETTETHTNGHPKVGTPAPGQDGREPSSARPAAISSRVEQPQTAVPIMPPVKSVTPPVKSPTATRIPQGQPITTSTIGQYGIWHLSAPTAAPNTPLPGRTGQFPIKGSVGTNGGSNGASRTTEEKGDAPAAPLRNTPALPITASETVRAESVLEIQGEPKKLEEKTPPSFRTLGLPQNVELSALKPAPESMSKESHAQISSDWTEPAVADGESPIQSGEIIEPAKPGPANLATAIGDKNERTEAPGPSTRLQEPSPIPAPEKKVFASNSRPQGKVNPAWPTARDVPGAKLDRKNTSEQQDELAVTLPMPRLLKPGQGQKEKLKISIQRVEANGKHGKEAQGFGARLKRWLNPIPSSKSDRRRALRRYVPGMVAFYYTGGAPKPHEVADISMSGFYLLTEDRWVPETMIRMTLQKPCAKGERKQSITVLSRIIRRGSDGIAAEFVMQESLDSSSRDVLPSQATDRFALARFL